MQRKTPIKYAALLSALLISSTSIPAVAQEASQPKLSPEVSNLLNKLMNKKPKASAPTTVKAAATPEPDTITTSDEALTPREFARSQQGPAPVKGKPKPIIIAPKPVVISSEMPTDKAAQPKTKRSLPDFVHNIYIRADYGFGVPTRAELASAEPNPNAAIHFRRSSMYGAGIGYKFNQIFRADINFQRRTVVAKSNIVVVDRVQQRSIFLNAYANLMDEDSYVIPYLTAGLGHTTNNLRDAIHIEGLRYSTSGKKTTAVSWNAGVGTLISISQHIKLDAAYRYLDFGTFKGYTVASTAGGIILGRGSFELKKRRSHEITGGLIINF